MAPQWGISLPTCRCQNKGRVAFAAIRADSFEIAEDDDKEGITCIVGEIIDEIHRTGVEFIPAGGKGLMTASFPKGQPLPAEILITLPEQLIYGHVKHLCQSDNVAGLDVSGAGFDL